VARNLLEHPSRTPLDRRAEKAIELLFARDHGGGEAIAALHGDRPAAHFHIRARRGSSAGWLSD
jgi:hypothetical protein